MVEPYYEHAGITIYHGDCREILPGMSADVLVTDPPYGHGSAKWSGGSWASNPIYDKPKIWDVDTFEGLEDIVYGFDCSIVWGGNYYRLPASRCWLAWVKSSRMKTMADFELAWTNIDKPAKLIIENRNPDGKRMHPTQKPLSVMTWCIGFACDGTIVDPFMGSGTTLLAAKNLGKEAIGIEIDEEYCEIAAKRLAQEVLF